MAEAWLLPPPTSPPPSIPCHHPSPPWPLDTPKTLHSPLCQCASHQAQVPTPGVWVDLDMDTIHYLVCPTPPFSEPKPPSHPSWLHPSPTTTSLRALGVLWVPSPHSYTLPQVPTSASSAAWELCSGAASPNPIKYTGGAKEGSHPPHLT